MTRKAAAAAKSVQMLDLLTEFFDGGENWLQHNFHDNHGRRCLLSALTYLSKRHNISGDATYHYLLVAFGESAIGLIPCNDACQSWDALLDVITDARRLALADLAKRAPLKGSGLARPWMRRAA